MAAVENVIVQGLFCVWLIQILDGGWNEGFKMVSLMIGLSIYDLLPSNRLITPSKKDVENVGHVVICFVKFLSETFLLWQKYEAVKCWNVWSNRVMWYYCYLIKVMCIIMFVTSANCDVVYRTFVIYFFGYFCCSSFDSITTFPIVAIYLNLFKAR